jgi:hypothetical protein
MRAIFCTVFTFISLGIFAQKGVVLTEISADKKVEITVDGKPFTVYYYPGPSVLK